MTGKLFLKIFVAFWLACCAVLASWMLASNYFDEQPPAAFERDDPSRGPPPRFLLRSLYELQNVEFARLQEKVEHARKRHGVAIYLIDANGRELLGQTTPQEVLDLADRLEGPRRRVMQVLPTGRMIAHRLHRSDAGPVHAVFVFGPPRGALGVLGENPWLRILLAVLVSGLVCYGLSRLMTSRLKQLQLASRSLANGDLDTRLTVRDRGGDETDELARDFNSMAAQLQQRIQAQKRLLSDVSHELRTPLARLRIALALAEQDADNREQHFKRLEQEAERLEELIAQLLSSADSQVNLDSHIDLVTLLRQLCADAGYEGNAAGKSVRLHTDQRQAIVASSGDLLRKCFENLLRNALTHTAPNTVVDVTLRQQQNRVVICVEDRGPGVPEAELGRLFEAFYRVDSARTRETGGYGLGLSIAQRIAAQHGGTLTARNTGNGLELTAELPLAESPTDTGAADDW